MIIPKIWDDPPIEITVSRQAVEVNYTKYTLDSLLPLVQNPAQTPSPVGKVSLVWDGYENESRKLWLVPEVRVFLQRLDEEFPYWHFLADLTRDTLFIVAACVCRIEEGESGPIFNKDDLLNFSVRQFDAMNQLYREWNLPHEEKAARDEQIINYFSGVQVQ